MILHLDTHVLVWLYAGQPERFPSRARSALDHSHLMYSPIAELELRYFFEIGRITAPAGDILSYLEARIGIVRDQALYSSVVKESCGLSWTRDPFDRLIVGAAMAGQHPLLTRDREIRRNCHLAFWDDSDIAGV